MGLVQCFVIALMLSAQLVLTFPLPEPTQYYRYYTIDGRTCKMCRAGEFQKSCTECEPCSLGSYTTDWNVEESCYDCYRDCRADYYLEVVQNCTTTTNIKCTCKAGYRCTQWAPDSNCRYCEKIQETTAEAAAIVPSEDKYRTSSASSGHTSTSAKPCRAPNCDLQSVPVTGNSTHVKNEKMSSPLASILFPLVAIGCLAFVILFFFRPPKDESCFKQAFAFLLCNKRGKDTSQKSKESTHQFARDSFSAKQQQPSSPPTANLGPVHVHNEGTVIFSLLSQFTGQVGPTTECGRTTERVSNREKDERDCPVFHPTRSPSIHLSEEERSGEMDSIFFPSQEQGKDCHVSKEESL